MEFNINESYVITKSREYDSYVQSRCRPCRVVRDMCQHSHEFYEFFLITAGTMEHIVNKKFFSLKKGDLVFIRKNDIHGASYVSPDNEHINFSFSQETLDDFVSFIGPGFDMKSLTDSEYAPIAYLSKNDELNLRSKMSEIFTPPGHLYNTEFSKEDLRAKSRYLLAYIFVNYFSNTVTTRSKIPFWLEHTYDAMKQPKNFIAGHERMVELSGHSPEHLSRSFKKYYKTTPVNYIMELRMNHAASLLLNSELSVTDICFECGFNSLAWFYETFTKQFGKSPRDYRTQKPDPNIPV